jgi:hypothetical protein
MNKPKYEVNYSPVDEIYTFTSIGPKGEIKKAVQIYEYQENVYNLGFGDLDTANDEIDDGAESGNGDVEIVLATVISIAVEFLKRNPLASITFKGNSTSRNRLYQIAINIYITKILLNIWRYLVL